MERLVSAVAAKDQFRLVSADQWHPSNDQHLLPVVLAELLTHELHDHRQPRVVDGELGGDGDVVLLVGGVHQPDLLGGEGDLLARGGSTGIENVWNPGFVPTTLCH